LKLTSFGRYRIETELGTGRFSETYQAYDPSAGGRWRQALHSNLRRRASLIGCPGGNPTSPGWSLRIAWIWEGEMAVLPGLCGESSPICAVWILPTIRP
jgi:hypothetical protein